VYFQLAIQYARLGRPKDEIAAYGEALRVQPVAGERSVLLANRAEAYMLLGDVTSAIAGYRASLALLTSDYLLFNAAPTTLWGLAVALDRSGDLDGGLETVRLARAYDPRDARLDGPSWFFLPAYDKYWYHALGHWAVARKADVDAVRAEAYSHAVTNWEEYVAAASRDGKDDKWVDIARVRLKQCEKERDEFLKRSRKGAAASTPSGRLDDRIRKLKDELIKQRGDLARGHFPPAERQRREDLLEKAEEELRTLLEQRERDSD
jgi:tetratricopeptide (TPR) repeat protein